MSATSFLLQGTPLEDHRAEHGLLVKREDLSCPPPGPPFSKTRGVLAHVRARYDEGVRTFGVLDTSHSQAGHAVAAACRHVGARCVNYFPAYKADVFQELPSGPPVRDPTAPIRPIHFLTRETTWGEVSHIRLRPPQQHSLGLGAKLYPLQAGRSAILFHQAKRLTEEAGGYMMPNALKLPETVAETAREVCRTFELADRATYQALGRLPWIVSASSGTIAAGVLLGLSQMREAPPRVILHMGYSRSPSAVAAYLAKKTGWDERTISLAYDAVDEGYAYADQAKAGPTPPWPCNPWYDLKAYRWWMAKGRARIGEAVLWNIG